MATSFEPDPQPTPPPASRPAEAEFHSESVSTGVAPHPTLPGWYVRLLAGFVFVVCVGLLGTAVYLQPDPRGFGTHEQLPWQAPCGFLYRTGYPCPTCSMTTAFSHTVRGQWLSALWTQPAGFLACVGAAVLSVGAAWSAVRGRLPRVSTPWLTPFWLFAGLLTVLLGGWAFVLVRGLLDGSLPFRPTG